MKIREGVTRLLILGGTTEGRLLAEQLANQACYSIILSLAGRTQTPLKLPVPTRIGGFGGFEGLKAYITAHNIDRLIDATHPYATIIKASAARACADLGLPLLAIQRPEWQQRQGDTWLNLASAYAACVALGRTPQRVFLTLGRLELSCFESAPQHIYLVRSVDRLEPAPALPHATYIEGRGPFSLTDEIQLLRQYRIETLISKNSGGEATYAKIEAARQLQIPVMLIARPKPLFVPAERPSVSTVEEALRWLAHVVLP